MLKPRPMAWALLCLLSSNCATARTVPLASAAPECRAIEDRGIFNRETLACFPEIATAVEDRLCEAGFWTHYEANFSGFGYGSQVFGQVLLSRRHGLNAFDRSKTAAWKTKHCRETADRKALTWSAVVDWWGDLYDRFPPSLIGPWRSCWKLGSEGWQGEGGLRCYLSGSYDVSGENEEIRFTAWNSPDAWLDFGARLRADLVVAGADCGGEEWPAGSRISSNSARVLTCRRRGRSAVRVKLVTGEGECERSLPELTAPPWRELCHSTSSSTPDTGVPGAITSSSSTGAPSGGLPRNR